MGRSGYSDDGEGYELWRGAVDSALYGKRGQAFLREMLTALDALPTKRLIAGKLVCDGECCALGAAARVAHSLGGVQALDGGESPPPKGPDRMTPGTHADTKTGAVGSDQRRCRAPEWCGTPCLGENGPGLDAKRGVHYVVGMFTELWCSVACRDAHWPNMAYLPPDFGSDTFDLFGTLWVRRIRDESGACR